MRSILATAVLALSSPALLTAQQEMDAGRSSTGWRIYRYTPRAVEKMFLETGFGATIEQHPMWYAVEAVKV